MAKFKQWCFTLNNPRIDELYCIFDWLRDDQANPFSKLIVGFECIDAAYGLSEAGTFHLQACFEMKNPVSFTQVKRMLYRAHIEVVNDWENAYDYCKKEGSYFELK